jgi:hypothetical protein
MIRLITFAAQFSPLYRILFAVMVFIHMRNLWGDINFSITNNERKVYTYQELIKANRTEIPKYITLQKATLADENVESTSETIGSGASKYKSFYYSIIDKDSIIVPQSIIQVVIEKKFPKKGVENLNTINAEFTGRVFDADKIKVLESMGTYKVAQNPILLKEYEEDLPNNNWSLLQFCLGLILLLIIAKSFKN